MHGSRGGEGDEGEGVSGRETRFEGFVRIGVDVDVGEERVEEGSGGFDETVGELGRDSDGVADRSEGA